MDFGPLEPLKVFVQFHRYTLYAAEASTSSSSLTAQSTTADTPNTATMAAPTQAPKHPPHEPRVCRDALCRNGGTCHQLQKPGGAVPSCHCPLHFTGTFCEKGKLGKNCSFFADSVSQSSYVMYYINIYIYNTHTQAVQSLKIYCTVTSTLVSPRASQQIMLLNIC